MKKTVLASLIAAGITATTPALAADIQTELAALKSRIQQLESQLADTQATQASANNWSDKVSVSGSAEFLGTATEDAAGNTESDLDVDSVELTIDAAVNENIALSTTLKYEDDGEEQDFYVDEAIIEIGAEDSPWMVTLGRTGVPFAAINGNAWTDPLTDDLTDNTDDIAQLSYSEGIFSADVYAFRARHDDDGDNTVENFGLNAGLEFDNGLSLGAGYLNNIRNTDPFQADSLTSKQEVAAGRLNIAYEIDALALSAEYIKTDSFEELAGQPKVAVWHASADYGVTLFGAPGNLSLGYSETDNAALITDGGEDLFAQSRLTLGASRELNENAELILELVREEDYAGEDTDSMNLVLSTSF